MKFPQHPSVFHYSMQQAWGSVYYIKDEDMKISQGNYMIQGITASWHSIAIAVGLMVRSTMQILNSRNYIHYPWL